ncbi:MAG: UDP-glucose/GDP-mannose dehydrogenase family protein [Deltaproteobacteria bacterium]|nr:UDP-glucose/GDP-mannose dehydrogenase family protein [Deltaproteobacteria bacterium]
MNICVVGTGYVGLVAGTCLSDFGMNVICVDKDAEKIERLNNGEVPIYEIGLGDLIRRNRKLNRLHFSTNLEEAVDRCLVIFLAVGTPEDEGGRTDLRQLIDAIIQIARAMKEYRIIAIKSTVPVGTAAAIRQLVKENLNDPELDYDIVSNPEFLREGAAVEDFLRPNRVVLGADSDRSLAIMRDIYRPLYLLETPIVCTNNETAEVIKYAANAMLALRISFINEVANLCENVGADVYQVATALGMDKRIGPKFLHPGPGFGGSCFPKDLKSLVTIARDTRYEFLLAEAVVEVNQRQRERVIDKARQLLDGFKDKNVCVLGLSFKPNTDDIRESPGLYVAKRFIGEGARVNAYDPAAMEEAEHEAPALSFMPDPYSACTGADLIIIITEWNEFRELDFTRIKGLVRIPNIYDTRNIYDPRKLRALGFTYLCTGRP